jgi:Uma2 family endonuclease
VIASGVAFEDFLTSFDGQHVEWVNGEVIAMSPVSEKHNDLTGFLVALLRMFLSLGPGGRVFHDPMVMRAAPDLPGRSPDIAVVLSDNLSIVENSQLAGPANLVIEIVSPESHRRDRIEKFAEYERGKVPEYWILDPIRHESLFYGLNPNGIYEPLSLDAEGVIHSRDVEKLQLSATIFWQDILPDGDDLINLVRAMLQS